MALKLILGGKHPSVADPLKNIPLFEVGQVVVHQRFDYRGVVVGVDETFQGTESWYETVALSRPPKDQPWYEVLVDQAEHSTYVAERHLEADDSRQTVRHPLLNHFFIRFEKGRYILLDPTPTPFQS